MPKIMLIICLICIVYIFYGIIRNIRTRLKKMKALKRISDERGNAGYRSSASYFDDIVNETMKR